MIYEYSIPEVPPSLNKYLGRRAEWEYRQEKQMWEQLVFSYCRPRPTEPIKRATVTLIFHFKNRIRHDPDNYVGGSKPLLDGLVRAGIIKDDSFDCIELIVKQGELGGSIDVTVEET